MKKISIMMAVVIAAVAVIAGFMLGGCSATAIPDDATVMDNASANGDIGETTALGGKKVYLYSSTIGFALSDAEAAALVEESRKQGVDSTFVEFVTTGTEIKDSSSGVVFVVRNGGSVNMSDGAKIYDVGSVSLDTLASGGFTADGYICSEQIETAYGRIDFYRAG